MSNRKPHPYTNRAIRQSREAHLEHKYRTHPNRERLYWMVNTSTNRRSDRPVTMGEFLDYIGRQHAVGKMYQLHEVK